MNKRFAPTKKRLLKARKEGDVGKCPELTGSCVAGAGTLALLFSYEKMQQILKNSYNFGSQSGRGVEEFLSLLGEGVLAAGGCLLFPFVIGLVVEMLQVGCLFESSLIGFRPSRVNPFQGLSRLLGFEGEEFSLFRSPVWEFLRLGILLCVVLTITFFATASVLDLEQIITPLMLGVFLLPMLLLSLSWSLLSLLLIRHERIKRLYMSLEELKEELRDSEGRHEIKQQRQELHANLPAGQRPKLVITGGGR
jgi:flagellar biosynthesis protein FlhB